MLIPVMDMLKEITSQTTFSYREVYAVYKYAETMEEVEKHLQWIAVSGMSVSEYLMKFHGTSPVRVSELLYEPCTYYEKKKEQVT